MNAVASDTRAGLCSLLEDFADRVQVVDLATGDPDVALYDTFGRLEASAVRVATTLSKTESVKLVVYSWNTDQRSIESSLAAGAAGFLSKGLDAERLVEALIAQGLTNQDIATRLYLSVNSVKTYIRSAYQKMGVERRSQAVGRPARVRDPG